MSKTPRAAGLTSSNIERLVHLQKELSRRLQTLDLTPNQAAALLLLQRCSDMRAMALGKALGVVPSSGTSLIFTLVRKGWVARIRSSDDHRLVILRLTQRGKEVLRALTEHLKTMPHIRVWS